MTTSVKTLILIVIILISIQNYSQTTSVEIGFEPLNINNLVGVKSFNFDQTNGKWAITESCLESHSRNITNKKSLLYSINNYSFITANNKSKEFSFRPTSKGLTSNKFIKASLMVTGYNLTMGAFLFIAPESFTNWGKYEKTRIKSISSQFKKTYTNPPVIDKDAWTTNYIGHPYQGSFYYNSLRSQEVSIWYSSLFCLGSTLLWEYVWEGGFEQPSIQDLIVTPLAGVILGELIHIATMGMRENGFQWYEVALVIGLNPAYAINNRFIFNPEKQNKNTDNKSANKID